MWVSRPGLHLETDQDHFFEVLVLVSTLLVLVLVLALLVSITSLVHTVNIPLHTRDLIHPVPDCGEDKHAVEHWPTDRLGCYIINLVGALWISSSAYSDHSQLCWQSVQLRDHTITSTTEVELTLPKSTLPRPLFNRSNTWYGQVEI